MKTDLFFTYRPAEAGSGPRVFVAAPAKALLYLVHLRATGDDLAYLTELRLQNLERLDLDALFELAGQTASPKLRRATASVARLTQIEAAEYEDI